MIKDESSAMPALDLRQGGRILSELMGKENCRYQVYRSGASGYFLPIKGPYPCKTEQYFCTLPESERRI